MSASNYVHIDVVEILKETERALLVAMDDGEEFWIPKACIADDEEYEEGDMDVTISVLEKFAREKGLDEYTD
jgi:hypothetical protein